MFLRKEFIGYFFDEPSINKKKIKNKYNCFFVFIILIFELINKIKYIKKIKINLIAFLIPIASAQLRFSNVKISM